MKLKHGCWVLVADGGKALILRNRGDEAALNLELVSVRHQSVPANRVLARDRPGRFPIPRGAMATSAQAEAHDQLEKRFIWTTVQSLLRRMEAAPGKGLVLLADPRSLGFIRQALAKQTRPDGVVEINKNFTHQELSVIENAIGRA